MPLPVHTGSKLAIYWQRQKFNLKESANLMLGQKETLGLADIKVVDTYHCQEQRLSAAANQEEILFQKRCDQLVNHRADIMDINLVNKIPTIGGRKLMTLPIALAVMPTAYAMKSSPGCKNGKPSAPSPCG